MKDGFVKQCNGVPTSFALQVFAIELAIFRFTLACIAAYVHRVSTAYRQRLLFAQKVSQRMVSIALAVASRCHTYLDKSVFTTSIMVLLLLGMVSNAMAYAEFKRIGVDDGLPNATIYSISQDQQGYIWLATTNSGLLRFDGYQFTEFPVLSPQEILSEGTQDVGEVLIDRQQNIWAGTWGFGLSRIDGKSGTLQRFLPDAAQEGALAGRHVQALFEDAAGDIWVGTSTGVSRFDATGRRQPFVQQGLNIPNTRIWNITQTQDGTVWLATSDGLWRYTEQGGFATPIRFPDHQLNRRHNEFRALYAQGNQLWVGTRQGLYRRDGEQLIAVPFTLGTPANSTENIPIINTLEADPQGKLLIGTYNGLYRLDLATAKPEPFRQQASLLPTVNIRAILVDRTGVVWIGSRESGLYFARHSRSAFTQLNSLFGADLASVVQLTITSVLRETADDGHGSQLPHRLEDSATALAPSTHGLTVKAPHPITARRDGLWLGTAQRLYFIDYQQRQLYGYNIGGRINAIRQAPDGTVYVGTDVGLFQVLAGAEASSSMDIVADVVVRSADGVKVTPPQVSAMNSSTGPAQAAVLHQPPAPFLRSVEAPFVSAGHLNRSIRDVVISHDGQLWLGLWGEGVLQWQPASGDVKRHLTELSRYHTGDAVQALWHDGQSLWVGTRYAGLYQINPAGELSTPSDLAARGLALPSSNIQCLSQDRDGGLLICTVKGLTRYWPKRQSSQHLSTADGLPSAHVLGAHLDKKNRLWVLSAQGLTLQLPDSDRFITFTKQDGLVASELVLRAMQFANDGKMYIGTIDGVSIMEPDLVWTNNVAPKVSIPSIRIDHHDHVLGAHQASWSKVELPPGHNSIEFAIASLDFHNVDRNQFLVRLSGVDPDWVLLQQKRTAYYANLPPGDYRFEVRGSNNHGLFSEQPEVVQIRVQPTWWQRPLHQLLLLLLGCAIIYAGHRYRLRHIRQINHLLQQAVHERSKAQLQLEHRVAERTRALEESSRTLSLRTRQLEQSLHEVANANHELKRLDRLKDEFISVVSHELRTPLTSIRGAVGLLEQQVVAAGSETYQVLLRTAVQNAERLAQLINDLLDVQKFEAGKFQLHLQPIKIADLLLQAHSALQSYADRYQVQLKLQLVTHDVHVSADVLRLRQVVDNLVSNAIKFSKPHTQVQIVLSSDNEFVKVLVIDQGVGIPKAFQHRIFEKFSQADASDSRAKEGSGLGLTICKQIIESHHGRIGFQSDAGHGSSFWFELRRYYPMQGVPVK